MRRSDISSLTLRPILQVVLVSKRNIRLNPNPPTWHNQHLLTAIILQPILDIRLKRTLRRTSTRIATTLKLKWHLFEAGELATAGHARAAEETGRVFLGDGFVGGDRGGEDADVGLDYGPVHCVGYDPGLVGGAEHFGDVCYSDDGRDAGTVDVSRWMIDRDNGDLQESETQDDGQADLLSSGNTKPRHQWNRQCVRKNIRKDIDSRIRQVESIDVNALLILRQDRNIVRGRDWRTLKDASQDICTSLTSNDPHHHKSRLA